MKKEKILVIGAAGQIGMELVMNLRETHGESNVVAADIKVPGYDVFESGPFEILDVLDVSKLAGIVEKYQINQVYLLAALLSATAEQNPAFAWKLNINGLFNILELAKHKVVNSVFWPSSIAVFGPNTPKDNTPQYTVTEPDTVYGISKLAGERWCEYYHRNYDVDVRSMRYPGLIGYKSSPGGGTTDYAVNIFYQAVKKGYYNCFLNNDTALPMMYMPDAIRATVQLMEAKKNKISVKSSYNVFSMSFSPEQLTVAIKKHIPGFRCSYKPDLRQKLAEGWPRTINDEFARQDWGWQPGYNLEQMVEDMLINISKQY